VQIFAVYVGLKVQCLGNYNLAHSMQSVCERAAFDPPARAWGEWRWAGLGER